MHYMAPAQARLRQGATFWEICMSYIYIYICMCLCLFIYTYVGRYTYIYIYIYAHMYETGPRAVQKHTFVVKRCLDLDAQVYPTAGMDFTISSKRPHEKIQRWASTGPFQAFCFFRERIE